MPHCTTARFERIRVPLARWIFRKRPFTRAALNLTPDSHPFKPFAASTLEDLDEFADVALRPRVSGEIAVVIKTNRPHKKLVAIAISAYLVAAQLVTAFPAVVVYHGPGKIQLFQQLNITEEPIDAPRLRVYFTQKKPSELDL